MSYYVHNVPGRLRVKTPMVKGNPDTAEDIRNLLKSFEGIKATDVSTLTGSVVINYDSTAVTSDEILEILERRGYFDTSRVKTNDDYMEAAVAKAGGVIGKALISMALDKMFEGSALSLLTVFI